MRLPVEWLHEYVRPDLDARELATRLAMTGTEVDRILRHGVGRARRLRRRARARRAERHPDADRLSVCRVDVGAEPTHDRLRRAERRRRPDRGRRAAGRGDARRHHARPREAARRANPTG